MPEIISEALVNLLYIVLIAFFTFLVRYTEEKIGKERVDRIAKEMASKDSLARRAVRLAEDLIKGPGRGAERLDAAVSWMQGIADARGFDVTEGEIKGLIQSVFDEMQEEIRRNRT